MCQPVVCRSDLGRRCGCRQAKNTVVFVRLLLLLPLLLSLLLLLLLL